MDMYVHLYNINWEGANWLGDQNPNLRGDMIWQAQHFGRSSEFWNIVRSDLPWQLAESIRPDMDEPYLPRTIEFESQTLSQHRVYSEAVLVRDSFQCFHRADGMTPTYPTTYYH